MMRTIDYVKGLKRTNGLPQAIKIAERCVKGSHSSEWGAIPKGPIFFREDKKGSTAKDVKEMVRTHNFWVEVLSLLRKQ